ncbi:MAG: molybdopterin cofactor-binding domain-containing protein [Bauldia sp.]
MNAIDKGQLSRRSMLTGGGALIVSFSLFPSALRAQQAPATPAPPPLPGGLNANPSLDAWIKIDASNKITVFTGKAELGQGTKTSLLQIAAEHLEVEPKAITFVTADTGTSPNEGFTAGSGTITGSGLALSHAAAQTRAILIDIAATKMGVDAAQLKTAGGAVVAPDGKKMTYGELVEGDTLKRRAEPTSKFKDPKTYTQIGKSLARVDIPAKVTGGVAFVHDLRLPGMLHARVVRPATYGAKIKSIETAAVEKMPGVVKVFRDGNFLAVVAEKEFQAVQAMNALAQAVTWEGGRELPADYKTLIDFMKTTKSQTDAIVDRPLGTPVKMLEAAYVRPYHMHGSIGPACAVAVMEGDEMKVWSHTQGVFPDRQAIAELLKMPEPKIRVIHMEGAGCYGHNGADDAAADAALIARALPGKPIRVQWTREQEHGWEPYGSAMAMTMRGGVDASGKIVAWDYNLWSTTHNTRPGGAPNLIAGWSVATPFQQRVPTFAPSPAGSVDRNATPYYAVPGMKVTSHFVADMPLRVSALRGLGAYGNVFAIESFMDEMAQAAGADPVEFRLRHLDDPRAKEVVQLAAEKFGWKPGAKAPAGRGYGFSFARYENLQAYMALAVEVEVERETGRVRLVRAIGADDSGTAVNPDAIKNQLEGGIIQAASWTLYEQVAFDKGGITSLDWSSYPILRFSAAPEKVEVHVIDRPGLPFLGTAEAPTGPTGAAIANAFANATGVRLRDLPFTRQRVKAAVSA